jgi:molybdopterin-synthase adenylyltransferase
MARRDASVFMKRPRVKPEHAPYRIADRKIRIGGVSYGLAAEITDPDGWVWTMLKAMDGSLTVPEIVDRVSAAHRDQPVEVLRRGADQLLSSGYIEDVAGPVPTILSERDIDRYDRAMAYFRWLDLTPRTSSWDPQARLRNARVTILGLGGTGGVAAMALAGAGVGKLHCVDFDVVELSNLSRQVIYTENNIGQPKVDSAVARLRSLNSDIEVTGQRLEATCEQDMLGLARDCDVLLLSADKPPALRTWTNRGCLAAKRPWVDSGYHGPVVQVAGFIPGEGPCWECTRLRLRDLHAADGAVPDPASPQTAAVFYAVGAVPAGLSGYLAAHLVIGLLTGIPKVTPGRIEMVNLGALDAPAASDEAQHPECPACGAARLWRPGYGAGGGGSAGGGRRVTGPAPALGGAAGRRRLGNRPDRNW